MCAARPAVAGPATVHVLSVVVFPSGATVASRCATRTRCACLRPSGTSPSLIAREAAGAATHAPHSGAPCVLATRPARVVPAARPTRVIPAADASRVRRIARVLDTITSNPCPATTRVVHPTGTTQVLRAASVTRGVTRVLRTAGVTRVTRVLRARRAGSTSNGLVRSPRARFPAAKHAVVRRATCASAPAFICASRGAVVVVVLAASAGREEREACQGEGRPNPAWAGMSMMRIVSHDDCLKQLPCPEDRRKVYASHERRRAERPPPYSRSGTRWHNQLPTLAKRTVPTSLRHGGSCDRHRLILTYGCAGGALSSPFLSRSSRGVLAHAGSGSEADP